MPRKFRFYGIMPIKPLFYRWRGYCYNRVVLLVGPRPPLGKMGGAMEGAAEADRVFSELSP